MTDIVGNMHTYYIQRELAEYAKSWVGDKKDIFNIILNILLVVFTFYIANKFPTLLSSVFDRIYASFKRRWEIFFNKKPKTKIIHRTVPNITTEKVNNPLYVPVKWLLSHEVDYKMEENVEFAVKDNITATSTVLIGKSVPKRISKKINFKGTEIDFSVDDETFTLYGEEKREKERRVINLSAVVPLDTKDDVLHQFVDHCVTSYQQHLKESTWQQKVYINSGNRWIEKEKETKFRSMTSVILRDRKDLELVEDILDYKKSKADYDEAGRTYSRTYFLYGPPGCGKSSAISGLSLLAKTDIYYLMINEIKSDSDLMTLFSTLPHGKCSLVIEDIDAQTSVVKSRELVDKEASERMTRMEEMAKALEKNPDMKMQQQPEPQRGGVTLSGFLNCLQGVFAKDGIITFITTNRPETLDPALIRDGRTHVRVLFGLCDLDQITRLFGLCCKREPLEEELEVLRQIPQDVVPPCTVVQILFDGRKKPFEACKKLLLAANELVANAAQATK
uniref:Mitochondrial chaperone BCS1 n=1 Tax=Clandestinovirus TaxID=2831644 RepID=A0A8F8KTG0_9VIRU|nr:mitochondrial chaperone BCS1 [Clandestinovirus]